MSTRRLHSTRSMSVRDPKPPSKPRPLPRYFKTKYKPPTQRTFLEQAWNTMATYDDAPTTPHSPANAFSFRVDGGPEDLHGVATIGGCLAIDGPKEWKKNKWLTDAKDGPWEQPENATKSLNFARVYLIKEVADKWPVLVQAAGIKVPMSLVPVREEEYEAVKRKEEWFWDREACCGVYTKLIWNTLCRRARCILLSKPSDPCTHTRSCAGTLTVEQVADFKQQAVKEGWAFIFGEVYSPSSLTPEQQEEINEFHKNHGAGYLLGTSEDDEKEGEETEGEEKKQGLMGMVRVRREQ